ncbi:hypothetical protein V6N12_074567 [Hibiscus sabdariffa]|uniref:Uncharacterized protein n=1 Tax=Hibiscus sabdariffa TaxID=183260 RepID=A0ABR2AJN6_9ROSI
MTASKGVAPLVAQSLPVPLTPATVYSPMASTPATEGQGGVPLVEQTEPMEKVLHQEQHQLPKQSPQAVFDQLDDGLNEAGSELPSLPSSQEESFQADNIGHATGIHSSASRELSHD